MKTALFFAFVTALVAIYAFWRVGNKPRVKTLDELYAEYDYIVGEKIKSVSFLLNGVFGFDFALDLLIAAKFNEIFRMPLGA